MPRQYSRPVTCFIIFIALVAWLALILQLYISIKNTDTNGLTPLVATWNFFSYFTILTNLLIALCLSFILLSPSSSPGRAAGERGLADKSVRAPIDVVAFQLVTMGRKASEHSAKLFKSDNYTDYLLFHGLSVESAEALAEMWHKRIREELGFAGKDQLELAKLFHQGYQGSRYSFGYPACPNIEDQTKLFELLDPSRIEVELTEEFMLDPEQSTSAIIVHHPDAKYFNIE